jgi:uncharacterized protein YdaU (DUF1376 family)
MANPWTAFYWSDYDSKTAHLTLAEDGAYRRLLSHYYQTRKPLSANADILLRVCRAFADSEKAAVTTVLEQFFVLEEDGYHNHRADEEIHKASQISEKRRDAGLLGAEKTNSQRSANGSAKKRQMPTQPQPQGGSRFALPNWIPREAWDQYEVMRKRIRKPMTDRARELAVKELEQLQVDGNEPELVLNQSILKSWQGLFALKGNQHGKAADDGAAERVASAYNIRA